MKTIPSVLALRGDDGPSPNGGGKSFERAQFVARQMGLQTEVKESVFGATYDTLYVYFPQRATSEFRSLFRGTALEQQVPETVDIMPYLATMDGNLWWTGYRYDLTKEQQRRFHSEGETFQPSQRSFGVPSRRLWRYVRIVMQKHGFGPEAEQNMRQYITKVEE